MSNRSKLSAAALLIVASAASAQSLPVNQRLETGPFVNFDSTPIKPIAVRPGGEMIVATNTRGNWLEVLDASSQDGSLQLIKRIPTGLDPVAVAFAPSAENNMAWVANFVGDDISVIDIDRGVVVDVIPVGDEPSRIIFDETGNFAFVITEGPSITSLASGSVDPRGEIVVIDVNTRQIVTTLQLDMQAPRGVDYDANTQTLYVAAWRSGNNTTIVGRPVEIQTNSGPVIFSSLQILRSFSRTTGDFSLSSLAPWPDPSNTPFGSPMVTRITDARGGEWDQICSNFIDPATGEVTMSARGMFALEFDCSIIEAERVLNAIRHERPLVTDHDLAAINLTVPQVPTIKGIIGNIGTSMTAAALSPDGRSLFITNLDAKNRTRHEPALRGNFMRHEVVRCAPLTANFNPPIVDHFDLHASISDFNDASTPNDAAMAGSLAHPSDIVCHPLEPLAYVAAMGTGRVGVIDRHTGMVLRVHESGRGTCSLTLDPVKRRLYAYNRTDFSITSFDLSDPLAFPMIEHRMVAPEPLKVKRGRDFFLSTRHSNNFSSSCVMCHLDGDFDGLAWDLGNPEAFDMMPGPNGVPGLPNHPVKGPMVTQSLKGLKNHEPFHWRGDKPRFVDFDEAFDGLLGGSVMNGAKMQLFDDYMMSVVYPPNPFYRRDNKPVSSRITEGFNRFNSSSCQGCHQLEHDGAHRQFGSEFDTGTDLTFLASQSIEFTQLRGLYRKFNQERFSGFGILHDGRVGMGPLNDPFATLAMGSFLGGISLDGCPGNLPIGTAITLSHFMRAFPSNVMNSVGWQTVLRGDGDIVHHEAIRQIAFSMMARHNQPQPECDVILRGEINGVSRAFLFVPNQSTPSDGGLFMLTGDDGTTLTLNELIDSLGNQDLLVLQTTPPGSGRRIAIDIDNDGCVNGLDTFPEFSADYNEDGSIDGDDMISFFNDWDMGDCDFDNNGATDGDDVIFFFSIWDIGC